MGAVVCVCCYNLSYCMQAPLLQSVTPCDSNAGVATPPCNPSGGAIRVGWRDPANTGGVAIQEWKLSVNGSVVYTGSNLSFTVGGLSGATVYCFSVAAVNGVGAGSFGVCGIYATATNTKPGSPGLPVVTNTTGDTICLSWQHPSDNGACYRRSSARNQ